VNVLRKPTQPTSGRQEQDAARLAKLAAGKAAIEEREHRKEADRV
jgi:hypothetical protein